MSLRFHRGSNDRGRTPFFIAPADASGCDARLFWERQHHLADSADKLFNRVHVTLNAAWRALERIALIV